MRDVWFEAEIKQLIKKLADADTEAKIIKIFNRILTPREINDIARRLKIWEMLEEGKSYLEIQDHLGVSPIIISKVSANIGYGFRRTSAKNKVKSKPPKRKRPITKYKGAIPIHRILG